MAIRVSPGIEKTRLNVQDIKSPNFRVGLDPRKPSGPAVSAPHRQAEHKTVPDPGKPKLQKDLATQEPSTQDIEGSNDGLDHALLIHIKASHEGSAKLRPGVEWL